MVDKELLSRKLSRLRSYVEALKSAEDIDWGKYQSDLRARTFVERYLHLAIEEVMDIANHLISFYKWREPTGYRDLFQILKEQESLARDIYLHSKTWHLFEICLCTDMSPSTMNWSLIYSRSGWTTLSSSPS